MFHRITGIMARKLPDRLELSEYSKEILENGKELPQIDNHRKNNGGRMSRRFSFDGNVLIVYGGRLKKQSARPLGCGRSAGTMYKFFAAPNTRCHCSHFIRCL